MHAAFKPSLPLSGLKQPVSRSNNIICSYQGTNNACHALLFPQADR
jgi:hypothetical protein